MYTRAYAHDKMRSKRLRVLFSQVFLVVRFPRGFDLTYLSQDVCAED